MLWEDIRVLKGCYFYQKMKNDIEEYAKIAYHVCQVNKTKQKIEVGLLQPLTILECSSLSVSMNFISGFPKVDGEVFIMVVVDMFQKYFVLIGELELCSYEIEDDLINKYLVIYLGVWADILVFGLIL